MPAYRMTRQAPFLLGISLLLSLMFFASAAMGQYQKFVPSRAGNDDATVNYDPYASFLSTRVKMGGDGLSRVNYSGLSLQDRNLVTQAVVTLAAVRPTTLNRDAQVAYWINLYNVLVVDVLVKNWPVEDIRIAEGGRIFLPPTHIWGTDRVTVEGVPLSLDAIEHEILRGLFRERRVHYALSIQTSSSPSLQVVPYRGATIDAMLDQAAEDYLGRNGIIRVRSEGLLLPSIFEWYADDFGTSDLAVLQQIRQDAGDGTEANNMLNNAKSIGGYYYSWELSGF
ncbi:MAG: DUF547 domain-containing protein [Alphaproteobacteria bacterium]|nr:DUF547 domain-containing protein [Alphaproteobacteria bacterium]